MQIAGGQSRHVGKLMAHRLGIRHRTGLSALRLLEERSIFCPASRPSASVAKLAPDPAESLLIRSSSAICSRRSLLRRGAHQPSWVVQQALLHPGRPRLLQRWPWALAESLSSRSSSAICRKSALLSAGCISLHLQSSLHPCMCAARPPAAVAAPGRCILQLHDSCCRQSFHTQVSCPATQWQF